MTSIDFGGGDAIEISLSLDKTRDLLQKAISSNSLVEFNDPRGQRLIINPQQVKLLQTAAKGEAAE